MIPDNWKEIAEYGRRKMTIGIGAVCGMDEDDDAKIILCSDWQVTSTLGSAETAFKQSSVGRGWNCLYAGEPSAARSMMHATFNLFMAHEGELDETNTKRLIEQMLQKENTRSATH